MDMAWTRRNLAGVVRLTPPERKRILFGQKLIDFTTQGEECKGGVDIYEGVGRATRVESSFPPLASCRKHAFGDLRAVNADELRREIVGKVDAICAEILPARALLPLILATPGELRRISGCSGVGNIHLNIVERQQTSARAALADALGD